MTTANTPITQDQIAALNYYALQLRLDSIRATTASKSGHPTSCLSAADIVAALFFNHMRYNPQNPHDEYNDRFILSKGHAIPVVYAAYKQLGIISDHELLQLRSFNSPLEGHPTPRFPYNEAATGSLGQGLSIGAGFALHAQKHTLPYITYVLMGDAEVAEGSVWEAANFAAVYKLDNLVGIVDVNRLGQTGQTSHGHDITDYAKKFEAFGWHVIEIDGHDMFAILDALNHTASGAAKPTMIIARTFKGHGLPSEEDKNGFHGVPIKQDHLESALESVKKSFPHAAAFQPTQPLNITARAHTPQKPTTFHETTLNLARDPNIAKFGTHELLATRAGFGYGLRALGEQNNHIMTLDADVKNSTYTEFFANAFPDRYVQCFVAEQNMVGVASGLALRGDIAFASTFGAFFSRAFDQIRMAGIGRVPLRLVGSHCGVSIGEDGPSQMALEDIAMMRSVPNSIVVYPSDAIAAYTLCQTLANYNQGISYMRTTRAQTPMIYPIHEQFPLGGCKILRQSDHDVACIVAAGITLHEALTAYALLKKEQIAVSVIDLYSIKPLDKETIQAVVATSANRLISVEDHYQAGGIGEALASELHAPHIDHTILCVRHLSRSGTPAQLLADAHIDAASIVKTVKSALTKNKLVEK